MRRILLAGLILATASLLVGWKTAEPGVVAKASSAGFTVQLPSGWIYDTGARHVVAARNGPSLDSVRVVLIPHKNAFKALKKPSTPDALPEDLAESYVANIQAEGFIGDVELLATDPAELAGRPAFRVHLLYRLPATLGGARMEQIAIGTALAQGLLLATYDAPRIHFFAQSLPAAEEALRTVTLTGAK